MTRDHPIIFSAQMVQALAAGRKTMTRRLAGAWRRVPDPVGKLKLTGFRPTTWTKVMPGDRLWVRENLCAMGNWGLWHDAGPIPEQGGFLDDIDERGQTILHRYAPTEATDSAVISPIHMPRWASRLTLIVTATKVEPLQEITEADAMAEGVERAIAGSGYTGAMAYTISSYRTGFARLWGDSWLDNPEVVALTFTVHPENIDAMAKAARCDL